MLRVPFSAHPMRRPLRAAMAKYTLPRFSRALSVHALSCPGVTGFDVDTPVSGCHILAFESGITGTEQEIPFSRGGEPQAGTWQH